MLAIGSIGTVDDSGTAQRAQVKLGYLETIPAASAVQQFGLASVPPPGTDAVVIFLAGNRASGVVVGTNNRSLRPTGQNQGDPCAGVSPTVQQRQQQVNARFVASGGQSVPYFITLAANLGHGGAGGLTIPRRPGLSRLR